MADIYDGAFRSIINDCKQFIIPFINEVFGETYTGDEEIDFYPNEHMIDQQDESDIKRITDTNFTISGKKKKKYHLECESSKYSSRILIRLFEYDAQIALDQGETDRECLKVSFPNTAVLYLRDSATAPTKMQISIETPGGTVSYEVPIAKIGKYSLDDIFDKRLFLILPFYIFIFEKDFTKYDTDGDMLKNLEAQFHTIVDRLEEMVQQDVISTFDKRTIIELSYDVIKELTKKYENLQKGVGDVMSGALIETEARRILDQGISQGISQGIEQGQNILIDTIKRLRNGESKEDIIASGVDEHTVDLALSIR